MCLAGVVLLALSFVAVKWPRVVTVPLAVVGFWSALALLVRSWRLHREGERERKQLPAADSRARGGLKAEEGRRGRAA